MNYLLHLFLVFISWLSTFSFNINIFNRYRRHNNANKKLIVVTGCDSGFGFQTSIMLRQLGYNLISTCLTDEGKGKLTNEFAKCESNNNVHKILKIDVCDCRDITKLKENVEEVLKFDGELVLWALVNNAGIAPIGHFDWMDPKTFEQIFDVNFFGSVNIIRALLPILKQTKNSRIVGVSSLAGLLSGPGFSAYAGSKHACEGFYKSLRQELCPWNIHVSVINPGFMKTR